MFGEGQASALPLFLLAQPFGVLSCAVEVVGGFERLEFAFGGCLLRAAEEAGDLGVGEWLEGARGGEGLLEDGGRVDACDDDGDGLGEAVL